MACAKARGRGNRRADRVDELQRRLDRRLRAPAHDRPRDRSRVALLAEVAQRPRQTALVPFGDDLACTQLLLGVHAHVQRRLIGVGEAALARVHLHRGHAEVEVRCIGAHALLAQELQRLGIAGADEAHRARHLLGQMLEALFGKRVPIDRHERARGAEALGEQPRVAAVTERAVDRRLTGLRVQQLQQLGGKDGRVALLPGASADLSLLAPRELPRTRGRWPPAWGAPL
jgi:hypothetical protein